MKSSSKKITNRDYAPFFLVNTHAHPDHTGANVEMVKEGAIVLAHRNAREHMIGYGVPGESGLPVVTFGRSMSIYAGDQRMSLIGLAPGHTDGDLALWVPGLNVLHTGDIFMSSDYPLIDSNSGGTIGGLIRSINRMIRLSDQDTVVIPGHGEPASQKQLIQYQKMLRNVSADVQEYKSQGLDVESVKDLDLTKKYDKKWGQGDLISGRQFVGFVYNTLPEQKAAPSKRSLPGQVMNGQHAKANQSSSTRFFAKKATLVMDGKGKAALSFDFNERADDQLDLAERDAHMGPSSSKALPTRDFVVGNGADPQAAFSFELVNPSDRADLVNLDRRLKRASFDGDQMEIEVVLDAEDLSLGRYSSLASDEAIQLEYVQIDRLKLCSLGDI